MMNKMRKKMKKKMASQLLIILKKQLMKKSYVNDSRLKLHNSNNIMSKAIGTTTLTRFNSLLNQMITKAQGANYSIDNQNLKNNCTLGFNSNEWSKRTIVVVISCLNCQRIFRTRGMWIGVYRERRRISLESPCQRDKASN